MSVVSECMERLGAISPPVFRIIEGAAALAAVLANNSVAVTPAAFVVIEEEQSGENERASGGPVLQTLESDIAIVIVASNHADTAGGAAAADIEDLKRLVRAALVGFSPRECAGNPIQHLEGKLLKFKNGQVWWRELFLASSFIEEPQ